MPTCPTCQTSNLAGTIFCMECGSSFLPTTARDTTTSLGVPELTSSAPLVVLPPVVGDQPAPSLRVVVLNSGRKISFSSEQPVVIGRQDRQRDVFPDLDLTLDGGSNAGVSRRHARLNFVAGAWSLEDLQSSNGTYINKHLLGAAEQYPVSHGDEVRLGNILLRLELIQ